jgi:hypothetical protein
LTNTLAGFKVRNQIILRDFIKNERKSSVSAGFSGVLAISSFALLFAQSQPVCRVAFLSLSYQPEHVLLSSSFMSMKVTRCLNKKGESITQTTY